MSATAKKARPILDIPVAYNGVTVGDTMATLGVKIERSHLNIVAADEALCAKQLTGRVRVCPTGDDPQQTYLDDADVQHEVAGMFISNAVRFNAKAINIGLRFQLDAIDIGELAAFAKKTGRLMLELVQPIEDGKEGDSEEVEE